MPTNEEFDKAVADFHRADQIEKGAHELREGARKVILSYWETDSDSFEFKGKTYSSGGVSITVPTKKGVAAHFDSSRINDAIAEFEDTLPEAVEELFIREYRFAGPEKVIEFARKHPEWAGRVAGVLLKYTVPATPDEAGTPRVARG